VPPLRVTRAISRTPTSASPMKLTTSCERAASKAASAKGSEGSAPTPRCEGEARCDTARVADEVKAVESRGGGGAEDPVDLAIERVAGRRRIVAVDLELLGDRLDLISEHRQQRAVRQIGWQDPSGQKGRLLSFPRHPLRYTHSRRSLSICRAMPVDVVSEIEIARPRKEVAAYRSRGHPPVAYVGRRGDHAVA
jgi:hypothetical protein